MGLYLVELYRSPNIGIFLRANDKVLLIPKGAASTKSAKLAGDLQVSPCFVSVGGTRLLGPLVAMNNRVSQSVPHLHVHIVPRTKGDGLRGFFWPRMKPGEDELVAVHESLARRSKR